MVFDPYAGRKAGRAMVGKFRCVRGAVLREDGVTWFPCGVAFPYHGPAAIGETVEVVYGQDFNATERTAP